MPIEHVDHRSWEGRRALAQIFTEPVQAASMAGESLRWLNHILGRIAAASEVYEVVGQLTYCLDRMPQSLEGLDLWLRRELEAGRLRHDGGRDVRDSVLPAMAELADVRLLVAQASQILGRAQRRLNPLYGPVEGEVTARG